MKNIIYTLAGIAVFWTSWGCKKPTEIGFMSDRIGTKEDTIYLARGIVQESQLPEIDGSSRPLTFKILQARYGKDGAQVSQQFLKPMKILTWKEAYDRTVHTTKEAVYSMIKDTLLAPVIINPYSGQLLFQTSTEYLTESEIYYLDVEVSNGKGSQIVKDYAIIKLQPTIPFEVTGAVNRTRIFYIPENSTTKIMLFSASDPDYQALMKRILAGTDPYYKVKKIADEPIPGIKMYLSMEDGYGNNVESRNIQGWPTSDPNAAINGTHQNWYWNATDTSYDAKNVIFEFPTTPWPYYSKFWPYPSFLHVLNYMETGTPIPVTAATQIDTAYLLNHVDNITDPTQKDLFRQHYQKGKGSLSFYFTTVFKFNQAGTWQTTALFPGVKIK